MFNTTASKPGKWHLTGPFLVSPISQADQAGKVLNTCTGSSFHIQACWGETLNSILRQSKNFKSVNIKATTEDFINNVRTCCSTTGVSKLFPSVGQNWKKMENKFPAHINILFYLDKVSLSLSLSLCLSVSLSLSLSLCLSLSVSLSLVLTLIGWTHKSLDISLTADVKLCHIVSHCILNVSSVCVTSAA